MHCHENETKTKQQREMIAGVQDFLDIVASVTLCLVNLQKFPDEYVPHLTGGNVVDYVIIGGGSSGCVVANRLSEYQQNDVLLVEYGGFPTPLSQIPGAFPVLQFFEEEAYLYRTERDDNNCLGYPDGCHWPRGKALGGSSNINAMIAISANRRDYERFQKAGCPAWSYEKILYYRNKSSKMDDPEHGYIESQVYEYNLKWADKIITAGRQFGGDFYRTPSSIINAQRNSVAKEYLNPEWVRQRHNLKLMVHTLATKLIIEDGRAVGVIVEKYGIKYEIYARKEVILAAGAIATPQLMMLSGLGPRHHLDEFDIKTIRNLKGVGQNLQDHLVFPLFFEMHDATLIIPDPVEYCTLRRGFLATTALVNVLGFINTKSLDNPYPNIQYHHMIIPKANPVILEIMLEMYGFNNKARMNLRKANLRSDMVLTLVTLLNPKSRGEILLRSTNPKDYPKIYANYYAEHEDFDTVYDGIKFAQKIFDTNELNHATPVQFDSESCVNHVTDYEYWKCQAKYYSSSIYHPVGTTKMGGKDDGEAVCDQRGRVYGVDNLRIVDAGTMPVVVSCNTNLPVVEHAEYFADMIKQDDA